MTFYEIPLIPRNHKTMTTVNGVDYLLSLIWNGEAGAWVMDISTGTGGLLVSGVALVTGTDLLGQYAYIGIGAALVMSAEATYGNLGTDAKLYYVS